MLKSAEQDLDINLKASLLIGDKERDIQAALNAGLSETYLFDESDSISVSDATKIVSKLEDIYSVNT
jgi:D-glycero-D-manno-heptose 1,7-bisphosphate phosphatase